MNATISSAVASLAVALVAMLVAKINALAKLRVARTTRELDATKAVLAATELELEATRAERDSACEDRGVAAAELAATKAELELTSHERAALLARLTALEQQRSTEATQLMIERDVLKGVRRNGIKQVRRAAYLAEALKTAVLQRRRWVRIGDQLAHELSEAKGKAATSEAFLAILERILVR